MQEILRNSVEDKQRLRAWVFGIGLSVFIFILMILGSGDGEVDPDMIVQIDPVIILVHQGLATIFIFIGGLAIFIRIALKIPLVEFFPKISLTTAVMVILICISFMVVNTVIIEWNKNLDFGNSDFAQWLKQSEKQLNVITEHLTNFKSTFHFILAFVVIAIIPAIWEELFFRGLIQNFFTKCFANHHLAIWVTGFIFSAIHLQFFGIIPRMLLGVLLGYLYHWSGKLSVAMLGHLVNNGFILIILFLINKGILKVSSQEMEQSAPWLVVFIFAIISFILMRFFYKKMRYA